MSAKKTERFPPEAIAEVLRISEGGTSTGDLALFSLADLVRDWIVATKEVQRITRGRGRRAAARHAALTAALKRQDELERDLSRAVRSR